MLCISNLFAIMYHNMPKLNKAALKEMLFLDVEYVHGHSIHILLFRYRIDNLVAFIFVLFYFIVCYCH